MLRSWISFLDVAGAKSFHHKMQQRSGDLGFCCGWESSRYQLSSTTLGPCWLLKLHCDSHTHKGEKKLPWTNFQPPHLVRSPNWEEKNIRSDKARENALWRCSSPSLFYSFVNDRFGSNRLTTDLHRIEGEGIVSPGLDRENNLQEVSQVTIWPLQKSFQSWVFRSNLACWRLWNAHLTNRFALDKNTVRLSILHGGSLPPPLHFWDAWTSFIIKSNQINKL